MFLPSIGRAVIVLTAWLPLFYEYCSCFIDSVCAVVSGSRDQMFHLGLLPMYSTIWNIHFKKLYCTSIFTTDKEWIIFIYIHTQLNMYYVQLGKYIKMCLLIYIICEFPIGLQHFRLSFTFETGPMCSGCALSVIFWTYYRKWVFTIDGVSSESSKAFELNSSCRSYIKICKTVSSPQTDGINSKQ